MLHHGVWGVEAAWGKLGRTSDIVRKTQPHESMNLKPLPKWLVDPKKCKEMPQLCSEVLSTTNAVSNASSSGTV